MKVFVVNLDRNPERLEFVSRQLLASGVTFERVAAVDGRTLKRVERKRQYSPLRAAFACGMGLRDGEIGCSLSHRNIYERMVKENVEVACVLEDDVTIHNGFLDMLVKIEKFANIAKAQVFMLSNGYRVKSNHDGIIPIEGATFTDAYVITRLAAERILRSQTPVYRTADSWSRWHRWLGVELYLALPTVAGQDAPPFATEIAGLKPAWVGTWRWKLWRAFGVTMDWILWKVTGR